MALCALLALLAFGFQGSRPIWEPDEGRYTAVALQMLDSGDWWTPRLNDEELHLAKPPLTYWLIAASLRAFGHSEWSVRSPWALAFLLTGLLVLDLARSLNLPEPRVAPFIWASSLAPFAAANAVTPDTILVLFETAAMAAAVRAGTLQRERLARKWLVAMWVAFGFAFLTKGPPALLPLLAVLAWRVWRKQSMTAMFHPAALFAFLVIGFSWFGSMVVRDPSLARYFVYYEFVERLASGVHHRNGSWSGLAVAYLPIAAAGAFPWVLIPLLRRMRVRAIGLPSPTRAFLFMWLFIPLAVFLIARSRLPLYLLPLFVPAALLLSPLVAGLARYHPRAFAASCTVWLITLLIVKDVAAGIATERDARGRAQALQPAMMSMSRSPDEIVFVGRRPMYGLRFYTGLPIERVELYDAARPEGPHHLREMVCQEAQTHEHPLWVVESGENSRFSRALDECGFQARTLARTDRWQSLEIEPASNRRHLAVTN